MKIVINTCYGGFSLSDDAKNMLRSIYRVDPDDFGPGHDVNRASMALVNVVQWLGEAASGGSAKLRIVEIPDGVEWTIEEYDGIEWVAETHRTWR